MIEPDDAYIAGSFSDLDRHARQAADGYLKTAQRCIDECFGEGYAAKHPELVATFMQVASAEYCNTQTAKVLQDAFYKIAVGVSTIAQNIERHGQNDGDDEYPY